MKYLHIYFLSLALMISFDLNASKYDKESASDLYKKATKQLKDCLLYTSDAADE